MRTEGSNEVGMEWEWSGNGMLQSLSPFTLARRLIMLDLILVSVFGVACVVVCLRGLQ